MSEYPEDVMKAANEVVTKWKAGGTIVGLMPLIADAIMAERQRCAKRAWNHFTQEKDGSNATRCGAIIAEAIME